MGDWLKEFANKILDNVPLLLILLGTVLFIIGLAGNVDTLGLKLNLQGSVRQGLAIGVGLVLLTIGLFQQENSSSLPKTRDYDVKILIPGKGEAVDNVDVQGTIKKTKLPVGYELRILRIYSNPDGYVPLSRARIEADGSWKAFGCNIGGKTGDNRDLGAFLVGPAAMALFEYHKAATKKHELTQDLIAADVREKHYLPTIATLTPDCIECARVPVVRK